MLLGKFNRYNIRISPLAQIGKNVIIGDNTVIYDNVEIGDNTIICNDCVIGEPLSSYYSDINSYDNPKTVIGKNSLIRSHTIIYSDNILGDFFQSGHRVTIREKTRIGEHCRIGTLCDIQGKSSIGDYVNLHSNVHVGQNSRIGNYCWVYPYTVFTNDPTPPSEICIGPTIEDYAVISSHCLLLSGVKVGKHCLIGAYSMVSKDIGDYSVAIGTPAKVVKDIREIRDRESGKPHYPWPNNFDRNMPWQGNSFSEWLKKRSELS